MVINEQVVISALEKQRLDELFGLALIDQWVFERLVFERDESLYDEFDLSGSIRWLLNSVAEPSLTALAKTISDKARG